MENNSISILLQLSRINLEELKSLLSTACVLRCAGKDLVKVTLTRTPVGRVAPQQISTSGAMTLSLPPSGPHPRTFPGSEPVFLPTRGLQGQPSHDNLEDLYHA